MIQQSIDSNRLHYLRWSRSSFDVAARRIRSSPAFIFFFFWSLWLSIEYLAFGSGSLVRVWDNGDQFVPARLGQAFDIWHGQFGFWSHTWASGVDLLASGMSPLLDVWLFVGLPGWLANGLLMWLQRLLAGYFTYRLLKDSLSLDRLPCIFGGLTYSLAAQQNIDLFHSAGFSVFDGLALPGLPFYLWSLAKIDLRRTYRPFIYAAGLGIFFSVTSYFFLSIFFLPLFFVWFGLVDRKLQLKFWLILSVFNIAWFLMEAPIIFAALLNGAMSHRAIWLVDGEVAFFANQLDPIGWLIRDNLLSIFFFSAGLAICVWQTSWNRKLFSAALTCGIYFGLFVFVPISASYVTSDLRFLAGFDFSRFHLVIPFLLIVSGSIGLHVVAEKYTRLGVADKVKLGHPIFLQAPLSLLICVLVGQSVVVKLDTFRELIRGNTFARMYENPDLQVLSSNANSDLPFRVATVAKAGQGFVPAKQRPAYAWAYGLETADGYVNLYPKRYHDFWGRVIGPLIARDEWHRFLFQNWGNQIYLFDSGGSEVTLEDDFDVELLSLANVKYIIAYKPIDDDRLILLPSIVDSESESSRKSNEPVSRIKEALLGRQPPITLNIYENVDVLPRFFLANNLVVLDDSSSVLDSLGQATREQLRVNAYMTKEDALGISLNNLNGDEGEIRLVTYTNDFVEVRTSFKSDSILVVTNNYSPYWNARVDTIESKVFPVDHTFQGIFLPRGSHEVILEYKPPYSFWRF